MGPPPVFTSCNKYGVLQQDYASLCSMALSMGVGTLIVPMSELTTIMADMSVRLSE
jgi:hypothetical protein